MPYGIIGSTADQTKNNFGVFSMQDVAELTKQGKFGGSFEVIKDESPSSVAAVNFTAIKESKYNVHLLQFIVKPDGNGTTQIRFSTNGGTSWVSTGYDYAMDLSDSLGNPNYANNVNGTSIDWIAGNGSARPNEFHTGYCYLYNLGNPNKYSYAVSHSFSQDTGANGLRMFGGGCYPVANTVNAIQFTNSASTFSGRVKLFGIKNL